MSRINILLFGGKRGGGMDKPGGAARAIFEYANNLLQRGHEVNIFISVYNQHSRQFEYYDDHGKIGWGLGKYWEKRLGLTRRFRRFWASITGKREIAVDWFDLKPKIHLIPDFSEKYIPDGDVIIAVHWWILLWINQYSKSKGKKIWFIRTVFFLPPSKKTQEILDFPFKKIVASSFMKEEVGRCGGKDVSVVLNGVNLKQFYNKNKIFNKEKRVCMVCFGANFADASFKGVEDGIKAFEIAQRKHPEIKLVMFGIKRGKEIPKYCEFHQDPSQDKIREIYSFCDIFLFPTRKEASANPPREAMACKCAVVGTTAGGITDYAVSGETALLSAPGDIQSLANNLIRLIEDEELLKKISLAGYEKIREFSWENQTKKLEEIILNAY